MRERRVRGRGKGVVRLGGLNKIAQDHKLIGCLAI